MYNSCPLLDNFIEFGRKREEKKQQKYILKLLENENQDTDSNKYNSTPSITTPQKTHNTNDPTDVSHKDQVEKQKSFSEGGEHDEDYKNEVYEDSQQIKDKSKSVNRGSLSVRQSGNSSSGKQVKNGSHQ